MKHALFLNIMGNCTGSKNKPQVTSFVTLLSQSFRVQFLIPKTARSNTLLFRLRIGAVFVMSENVTHPKPLVRSPQKIPSEKTHAPPDIIGDALLPSHKSCDLLFLEMVFDMQDSSQRVI